MFLCICYGVEVAKMTTVETSEQLLDFTIGQYAFLTQLTARDKKPRP